MPLTLGIIASSGGVSVVPVTNSAQDAVSSSFTFSSLPIGDPSSGRFIAIAVVGRDQSSPTPALINSVTIGGIGASRVVGVVNNGGSPGNYSRAEIWIANVPSGTTANVVVSYPAPQILSAVALYRVNGITSGTAYSTSTSIASPATLNLNVPTTWAAIGVSYNVDVGGANWSGLNEYLDYPIGTTATTWTSASQYSSGAQFPRPISVSWPSYQDTVSCCAVWGR